jgi:hypothetical protein
MLTLPIIRAGALAVVVYIALAMINAFIGANVRQWVSVEGHDHYIVKFAKWVSIRHRGLWLCLAISGAVFVWSVLPGAPPNQNIAKEVSLPQQPPTSTVSDNKPAGKHIERPQTLFELFKSDFSNLAKLSNEVTATIGNTDGTFAYNILVKYSIFFDFNANSKFYSFYIPKSPDSQSFNFSTHLAIEYPTIINRLSEAVTTSTKDPGGPLISSSDLVFSGRIYLYHEDEMTLKQKAELEDLFKANGAHIIFRGLDYQQTRWLQDAVPKNEPGGP